MNKLKLLISCLMITSIAHSQVIEPVKWSFSSTQAGEEAELVFTAVIDKGWHLYDTALPEGGPIPTDFLYEDSTQFVPLGKMTNSPEAEEKFDKTFQMNLRYFSDTVVFRQKIKFGGKSSSPIRGHVNFMACNDEVCLPPNEVPFVFNLKEVDSAALQSDSPAQGAEVPVVPEGKSGSLWLFILLSLAAGFAAILTPCVFPMIPMTVSFFMRSSGNRSRAIRTAIIFGLSIVSIFALLGALFSFGIFGPNTGTLLSTHWIPNLLFFILFFIFALSFFGLFEIVLPGSLVSKTDAQADKGGMAGAFFMALTTVIVSFSCTGPFIGALIIEAVRDGGLKPLIGMFFFGLAFATPFTLLAIFPSALSKLPKSGDWLNAIKVTFAFILLAFGLKFLSNIDQVYGFNLLSREIYLILWIVLFAFLGLYFLRKIKFLHDSAVTHLGIGRLFLALLTFSFVLYLFTGLLGDPLKSISPLLPPPSPTTLQTTTSVQQSSVQWPDQICGPATHSDKLHLPSGIRGYFNLQEGLECAKKQKKPAFIVFKGHACASCKKMENSVWTDPEVIRLLSENYVVIGLYTDDRTTVAENEWVAKPDGRILKTMGKINLDLEVEKYSTNSIPFHVIIKPDGEELRLAVTFNTEEFREFLKKGIG